MSQPKATTTDGRAIAPKHSFAEWPKARARTRRGNRYTLVADINSFYQSLYTHSIPWAIHSKAVAKSRKTDSSLIGNKLDDLLRSSNDLQTVGIPIGPDVSLLIAEIILSAIDTNLSAGGKRRGIRYLDDYEFAFASLSEADQFLAELQGALGEYELHLNPRKTYIQPLPLSLEQDWVAELKCFLIRDNRMAQENDLVSFFSKAFLLAKKYPEDAVLKYALGRTASSTIDPGNFSMYQDLILQIATVEPGALPLVVNELQKYRSMSVKMDAAAVGDVFSGIISTNAPIGHGSEVAWALWGMLCLQVSIAGAAEKALSNVDDPVVALLALDAQSRHLLSPAFDTSLWDARCSQPSELLSPGWLLAYEATVKGWLPSATKSNLKKAHHYFADMADAGVTFYTVPASGSSTAPKSGTVTAKAGKTSTTPTFRGIGGSDYP